MERVRLYYKWWVRTIPEDADNSDLVTNFDWLLDALEVYRFYTTVSLLMLPVVLSVPQFSGPACFPRVSQICNVRTLWSWQMGTGSLLVWKTGPILVALDCGCVFRLVIGGSGCACYGTR